MAKRGRKPAGARVSAVYFEADRQRYAIHVYDSEGTRQVQRFETQEEADRVRGTIEQQLQREEQRTVSTAIEAYLDHVGRQDLSASRKRQIAALLHCQLEPVLQRRMQVLTPVKLAQLYEAFCRRCKLARRSPRLVVQTDQPISGPYKRHAYTVLRMFCEWSAEPQRGWLPPGAMAAVKRQGEASEGGQPQLSTDQMPLWYAAALEQAQAGKDWAVACLTVLLLGLRPSELLRRRVEDLDQGGAVLHIGRQPGARVKNKRARRTRKVPAVLQPLLLRQAAGKQPTDLLFPGDRRSQDGEHCDSWMRRATRRICALAGLPQQINARSLRAMWSSAVVESDDDTNESVAQRLQRAATGLGHGRTGVAEKHYVAPEVLARAREQEEDVRQQRLIEVLERPADPQDEIARLQAQIDQLQAQLAQKKRPLSEPLS